MHVLLIRHAAAEERDEKRFPDDTQRPLTRDGAARFQRFVRSLRPSLARIDRLLSSRYVRAWQTAGIVSNELRCAAPIRAEALEEAGVDAMLAALREHAIDHVACVAMVGHEPFVSAFAATLLAGSAAPTLRLRVRKGAVVALRFDAEIAPGGATLEWMLAPRNLAEGRARG